MRSPGGTKPVIDYDGCPPADPVPPAESRIDVYRSLSDLHDAASCAGDARLVREICAHMAYLREVLGQRTSLDAYVRATQGCSAAGWPEDYVTERGDVARALLQARGISWGPNTERELEETEARIDVSDAPAAIKEAADKIEPAVRGPRVRPASLTCPL